MSLSFIFKTFVNLVIPLLAAVVLYFLGKSAYFRQKEYELITKRYLEESLDAISKNVERSLALFRYNWWKSTVVLKQFRELGADMHPELYQTPYIEPDPSYFEIWRDYRLIDVVGDGIFYWAHQSLDAFIRNSYTFFQDDLGAMVRVTIKGGKEIKVNAEREKIFDEYEKEVKNLIQKSHCYYVLLRELQNLSALFQTERFSFGKLKKLKNRKKVKASIRSLKEHFSDTLESVNGTHGVQA